VIGNSAAAMMTIMMHLPQGIAVLREAQNSAKIVDPNSK
jgi:uncharacterized protein with PQ loop repeat